MKDSIVNVGDSLWYLALGILVSLVIFLGVRTCFAQQALPLPPIPPPAQEDLRETADGYNTLLLQQVKYWEASAKSLWKQVNQLMKERDEALAKLKTHEAPPAAPAPQESSKP